MGCAASNTDLVCTSLTEEYRAALVALTIDAYGYGENERDRVALSGSVWVAVVNKRPVVGYIEYVLDGTSIFIRNAIVDPLYRRQGVLRTLLSHVPQTHRQHLHIYKKWSRGAANRVIWGRLGFTVDREDDQFWYASRAKH